MTSYPHFMGFFTINTESNQSEISHHNPYFTDFQKSIPSNSFKFTHISDTSLDTKYLIHHPNGYYYFNIRINDRIYKHSLKTKDSKLSIDRRNKILTSLNSQNFVKHDKITLSITRRPNI